MKKLYFLVLYIFLGVNIQAQTQQAIDRFPLNEDGPYDASIPSPTDYLGYELGDEYTFHYQIMGYFEKLAEVSDKITFHKYADTYEGRSVNYAIITSKSNHGNLENIRKQNLKIANNPESAKIGDEPIIVWMSYNVHGNEPSSSEAAMQTAYHLVASTNQETTNWLDNAVVIIDPMINPDGRDRYVYWYKSSQANVLNSDVADLEHDEIWPGGRTNHYWFDLNRDWTWLVHPESRGRIKVYQQWMPQVHIDFHEQGYNNNYFTMPGTTPRNHELPADYEMWADVFGRGAIAEFDKAQVNFETRERFDFFYPGYGSSYPSIMGGIAMLAEQGGHSRGGRSVETNDGYHLTLRQRLFDHYRNGVSIVNTSVTNREKLLTYFKDARSQKAQKGNTKAYILPHNDNDYTYDVVNMFIKQGVTVEQAETDFSVKNAFNYWDGKSSSKNYKKGDFIIKTDQPSHLFINTLMRRNLEIRDSVMYDMSTWSVPLAYNLDAAWTTSSVGVKTVKLSQELSHTETVENNRAKYAYVIDWKQRNAPKALAKLWDKGYKVRSTEKGFSKNGVEYTQGSLIVLLGRNRDKANSVHADMKQIAEVADVKVVGFDTGRMDTGSDLGAAAMRPVEEPKVAMIIDSGISSYTAGQMWFLFDQWTEFGISRIRSHRINSLNLNDYDVILLPNGFGLDGVFNDGAQAKLKTWVRDGGTLVAAENSATWLTKDRSGFTSVELYSEKAEEKKEDGIDPAAYTKYKDQEDSSGLKRIPGSAFKGMIDNSHPLAFGMPNTLYSLKFGSNAIKPDPSFSTVGYYVKDADNVLAAGYASEENNKKAAGMAFAAVQNMGRGKVVFLMDNTQYRMFWVGPARMVQNAVMLMPGF